MTSNLSKVFLLAIPLLFLAFKSEGQDIHLSHIHASPTALNPAMNGLFKDQARVIANARSQWNSVTNGYKTVMASADMKLMALNDDFISGGLQIYADRAGDLDFTTTSAALSFSYLKSFDARGRNFLSLGVQNSWVNNSVDYTKIVAFDNIPALESGDILNSINYWDFSAGLGWFYVPSRYDSYYVGFSAFHLNNPNVGFRNAETSENATTLYRRFNLHGGATIRLSPELTIKPSFIFMDQGPHKEITIGSFFRYKTYRRGLHKRPLYFVYLGGWLRSYFESDVAGVDAIVASIKYEYRKLNIAISYDFNISSYRLASVGRGGLELSLIRTFDWARNPRKANKVKCPEM